MLYGDASMCVAPMSADINTHTHTHTHTHAGVHAMDTDSAITMVTTRIPSTRVRGHSVGLPRGSSPAECARAPPPAPRRCARC